MNNTLSLGVEKDTSLETYVKLFQQINHSIIRFGLLIGCKNGVYCLWDKRYDEKAFEFTGKEQVLGMGIKKIIDMCKKYPGSHKHNSNRELGILKVCKYLEKNYNYPMIVEDKKLVIILPNNNKISVSTDEKSFNHIAVLKGRTSLRIRGFS